VLLLVGLDRGHIFPVLPPHIALYSSHTHRELNEQMNSENGDESRRANCTCILALFTTKWNQQRSHGEHRDYLKAGSSRPLRSLRAVRWTYSSVFASRLLDLTRRPPPQDVCHAHHSPFCTTQHADALTAELQSRASWVGPGLCRARVRPRCSLSASW
jgi:hypothetical protein